MLAILALALLESGWSRLGLADPVRLRDGTGYVDSEHGHAHPLWVDMDSDGKTELIVGQFEGGKGRVYANKGEEKSPKFDGFTWIQAGGTDAKVPYG